MGWLKWRKASGFICDRKVPTKLKGKLYCTAICPAILYGSECWALKGQHERKVEGSKNENVKMDVWPYKKR